MPVSERQKAARNKWDAEHMTVIGCKLKIDEAERFKKYAKEHNTSVNALFSDFVRKCLSEEETGEDEEKADKEKNINA